MSEVRHCDVCHAEIARDESYYRVQYLKSGYNDKTSSCFYSLGPERDVCRICGQGRTLDEVV